MKSSALERFRKQPDPLNCAQSVLYAYQKATEDASIAIADMKPYGGGRAPGGICGALHTACTLAPAKADKIKAQFAAATGSIYCRDIKQGHRTACEVCVSEAAQLLGNELH